MRRLAVWSVFGVVLAGAATATAFRSDAQSVQQWPAAVRPAPDASPALAPRDALKTFSLPPGYRLELVASEPLVQDPIAMAWDVDRRLWVVEMPGFVRTLDTAEPNLDPIGRIVVLQDTNHDGTMDTRTVFADGLVLPRSVAVLDHGVLVAEPPNVWLMHDTNGDLKMDRKELVTAAYGRREARVEQNANAFLWGVDNRIYTADSDVDLRWRPGGFEVLKTLSRGEWGVTEDDAGFVYRNTNESAAHVDLVPTSYFFRNPNLLRTRGSYDALDNDNGDVNVVWPAHSTPGTNRAYQFGIRRDDGTLAKFTSVCAPLIYRGDRLPDDVYGNLFVAEPAANLVSRIVIRDTGTGLEAKKAYGQGEFLTSTDERFRPVFLSNAPDGTLYIVDMYRGVIQQRADVTEYLRDQIKTRQLEEPIGLGRIYRVVHETRPRDTTTGLLAASSVPQLVRAFAHPNGWWRETAERLIVERQIVAATDALKGLADASPNSRARLRALWTLDGLDQLTPAIVERALQDPNRDVRRAAVRLSERWLGEPAHPLERAIAARVADTDWAVWKQVAASIGALAEGTRETTAVAMVDAHASDPVAMDALLSGLRGREVAVLSKLIDAPAETPARQVGIALVAGTLVRASAEDSVQTVLEWIADTHRPSWQRAALLRGVEVALLGGTLPGTPTVRRGAPPPAVAGPAPCSTCPGGRAGPGGAYAFAQVPATNTGRGGPRLRLNHEPKDFTALATRTDDVAPRVTAVLARIDWPGKPGAAVDVAPLTADEQARFEAGREVFRNVCQSCHQADGRGQDKIAANLIGSPLALAAADIPARIVLNGKEGPIGLMPPVGSVLSNEQIAAVLTYIRREWGQTGSAVSPADVAATRAATAGRTRPWTHEELLALAGKR